MRIGLLFSSLLAIAAFGGPALAATEKEFITDAIKGDTSEIVLGQLALSKAGDGVKNFAKTLIDDHSKGKAEASLVAQKLGLAPPDGVAPEAQKELTKLQRLSGVAFDQEFARYMVDDHEKDIAKFRDEAANGGGDAKQLAEKTLPVLQKHLEMAKALQAGKQAEQ